MTAPLTRVIPDMTTLGAWLPLHPRFIIVLLLIHTNTHIYMYIHVCINFAIVFFTRFMQKDLCQRISFSIHQKCKNLSSWICSYEYFLFTYENSALDFCSMYRARSCLHFFLDFVVIRATRSEWVGSCVNSSVC